MNYCGACGAPISGDGTRFCGSCGAALQQGSATVPASALLPPLKAAKKTHTGALAVAFVSVALLAGALTVMLLG
ncbi:MAG: hypothetical protein Q7V57_08745 [Actinomycetota bacterium]|nr:hypothetical protein [Actinomycetota bacterium]